MGEPKRYLMALAASPPMRLARVNRRSCVDSSTLYVMENDRAVDSSASSLHQKPCLHIPFAGGAS